MDGSIETTRRTLLAAAGTGVGTAIAGCTDLGLLGGSGGGATTVEGFEDGALAWTENGVDNESGVQTETVRAGDRALAVHNAGGADSSYTSLPGDGLGTYPSLGDDVSAWVYNGGGRSPTLAFGYLWQTRGSYSQNGGEGYAGRIHLDEDRLEIGTFVGGSHESGPATGTSQPLESERWYRLAAKTSSDGQHRFAVETADGTELGSVEMTDDRWQRGGYALIYHGNGTAGTAAYWDDIVVG